MAEREALKTSLARYRDPVQRLAPKNVEADRLLTSALLVVNASDALQKCSVASIGQSVMKIAQWGLDIGTTAHLVPFKGQCTAVADYKGLIQLMRDCGARDVDAQVVREGDVFTYELGLTPILRHVPNHTRGTITHAYAVIRLPHGVTKFEVMALADIETIRKTSLQWNPTKLAVLPEWYARKTVIRRIAKYVPMYGEKAQRLAAALSDEEIPDAVIEPITGDVQPISEHLPTRAPVSKLATIVDAHGEIAETPDIIKAFAGEPDYEF